MIGCLGVIVVTALLALVMSFCSGAGVGPNEVPGLTPIQVTPAPFATAAPFPTGPPLVTPAPIATTAPLGTTAPVVTPGPLATPF
jgi:hypothetical protein